VADFVEIYHDFFNYLPLCDDNPHFYYGVRGMNINEFLNGYIDAMLWSSGELEGCDLSEAATLRCATDCARFMQLAAVELEEYEARGGFPMPSEYAGHDFWLTRAGHGAGFWDRGLDELGDRLTVICEQFPSVDAYSGDDGKVYLS
jgi:hypothetical protein